MQLDKSRENLKTKDEGSLRRAIGRNVFILRLPSILECERVSEGRHEEKCP